MADLEQKIEETKIRKIDISEKNAPCPKCYTENKRHSFGTRKLKDIGISSPLILEVRYSKHYCEKCDKHYSQDMSDLAQPSSRYSSRVKTVAMNLAIKQGLTYEKTSQKMAGDYHVWVPPSTLHGWVVEDLKPFSEKR